MGDGYAPALVGHFDGGPEDLYEVHSDHLDTPRLLTDSGGVARWRVEHSAFGEAVVDGDPDGDGNPANNVGAFNVRFPGQYFDGETGLHYNRFRYYGTLNRPGFPGDLIP